MVAVVGVFTFSVILAFVLGYIKGTTNALDVVIKDLKHAQEEIDQKTP